MKRDIDTVAISLNNEKLHLQVMQSSNENVEEWYQRQQAPHSHTVYELHFVS